MKNNQQPAHSDSKPVNKRRTVLMVSAATIVFAFAVGAGVYAWQDQKSAKANEEKDSKIAGLEKQIEKMNEELSDTKDRKTEADANEQASPVQITQAAIKKAFDNRDYASLEKYYASKVSGGVMVGEPFEVVDDPGRLTKSLTSNYNNTKTPWDFDSRSVKAGDYRQAYYDALFTDKMFYGFSADESGKKAIVSFGIDADGKISEYVSASQQSLYPN